MLFSYLIAVCLCINLSYGVIYDSYSGEPASDELVATYEKYGVLSTCTIDVKPCDENERRREDGTCNSLKYPSRGTFSVPQLRLLPAHFYNSSYPRKAKSGGDLTAPRLVRLNMLKEGNSIHKYFNHLVPFYGIFMFSDVGAPHDTANMLSTRNYCCQKEHMNDYGCTPTIIREDDPVHRFSGIRCMNSTRPLTFQEFMCTQDPVPSPFVKGSPAKDLSQIYNPTNLGSSVLRTMSGGLLEVEEENGLIWPPNGPVSKCLLNQPDETRCFKNYANAVLPITLFLVWFIRFHNLIAKELAAVNPDWDDETLFQTARDINIAFSQQVYIYEWMAALQGEKNLDKAGVTAGGWFGQDGFRDDYDENSYPLLTMDYTYVLRWFHLFLQPTMKMYDPTGQFIREIPMFNMTFRPGFLAKDKNMLYSTQAMFRQPCNAGEHSIARDVGERGIPHVQVALDITAGDISKGRYFGMAPYIDYVELFTGRKIKSFDDLSSLMSDGQIALLKWIYDDPEDIDMIAGMWAENPMEGGKIPETVAKIFNDDVLRAIKGDRHWFERPNRPYAFTRAQLKEIRKSTLALMLCSVADGVTEIQKKAFFNISPENKLVSCDEIPKIDFTKWSNKKSSKLWL